MTSRRARLFDADQPPRRCWWSEGRSRGTGPRRASARAPRTRGRTRRDSREGPEADAAAVEEEVEAAEARAVGRDGDGSRTSEPAFVARAGSSVGAFLLLTGQRSAVTLRAGPEVPSSPRCRTPPPLDSARSRPSLYALASPRTSPGASAGSLPARVWDRCGAEWIRLEAGARLRPETSVVADPDGVYVVVTGCLRVASENAAHDDQTDADWIRRRRKRETIGFLGAISRPGGPWRRRRAARRTIRSRNTSDVRSRHAFRAPSSLRVVVGRRDAPVSRGSRHAGFVDSRVGIGRAGAAAPRALVSLAARGRAFERRRIERERGPSRLGGGVRGESRRGWNPRSRRNHGRAFDVPSDDVARWRRGSRALRAANGGGGSCLGGCGAGAGRLCGAVLAALRETCVARVADSASRLAEVGQAGVGPLAGEATAHWLAQLEATNDVVLLKADPFPSPWCAQCSRHADAILLVAAADDSPPGAEEGHVLQARLLGGTRGGGLAQRELVLLHTSAELTPTGTRPWLEAFGVHRHHHVARAPRTDSPRRTPRDWRVRSGVNPWTRARGRRRERVRARRRVDGARGGRGPGGHARRHVHGFVRGRHIRQGTHRVTHAHHRAETRRAHVQHVGTAEGSDPSRRELFQRVSHEPRAEPLFRGAKIEDCWLPFFCMTPGSQSCAPIVHRNGTLWRYVRASSALVGSPVCDRLPPERDRDRDRDGVGGKRARSDSKKNSEHKPGRLHVLVDGGYVNNLPTDVARARWARASS